MAICLDAVCSPCNSMCATACRFSVHLAKVRSLSGSECPVWQEYGSWRYQAVGCTREASRQSIPSPRPTMTPEATHSTSVTASEDTKRKESRKLISYLVSP